MFGKGRVPSKKSSKGGWLTPSPGRLLVVETTVLLISLWTVAWTPAARVVVILLAIGAEVTWRCSLGVGQSFTRKALFYLIVLLVEYIWILPSVSQWTTKREVSIPGIRVPPRDFPGGTSGDPRVVNGPHGIVPSPHQSIDVLSVLSAVTASAIQDGDPYVTGDDFAVIIPGRDEDLYLAKTIRYTIENTPKRYLKEIIVVDDASTVPMAEILDRELPSAYRQMVQVYRFEQKEGLIRARIFGADKATASNIFFLDGHCKPKPGWIEPLLRHLKVNYKRLACPVIQDIRKDTWEDAGTSGAKMMFEWNFEFGWYDDLTDEVPVSAGGIIALTRKWWDEGGKYDPGMLEWGGENLEQSMRFWMCGGEVFVVRDSFVGHIFDRPPKPNPENRLVLQVQKNQKRAAKVWLGDYYRYFEEYHSVTKTLDEGPGLEERFELKERLKCMPFEWYVNKFRTSFERKSLLIDEYRALVHPASGWCLTAAIPTDAPGAPKHPYLVLDPCRSPNYNQEWQTVAGGRLFFNRAAGKCLDIEGGGLFSSGKRTPVLKECDWNAAFNVMNPSQTWQFDGIHTGHIFSAPLQRRKSLTGNDRIPIDPVAAQSPSSFCLASSLRFWEVEKVNSSSLVGPEHTNPVDIDIVPCGPSSNGTLGVWADSLYFRWAL